jgi:hypothetical protein
VTALLAKLGHHGAHAEQMGWPGALVAVAGIAIIAFALWLATR